MKLFQSWQSNSLSASSWLTVNHTDGVKVKVMQEQLTCVCKLESWFSLLDVCAAGSGSKVHVFILPSHWILVRLSSKGPHSRSLLTKKTRNIRDKHWNYTWSIFFKNNKKVHTCFNSSERFNIRRVHCVCFHRLSNWGDVTPFSSGSTERPIVTAAVLAEKDELVGPLDAVLFAFGGEGPDDTLKVRRLGDDDHLSVRHGRVIHDADAIWETLTGSRFFGQSWCTALALGFSCCWCCCWCWWHIILLKGQLSSSEDQGSPRAPSHGHQITENAPWCSLVLCKTHASCSNTENSVQHHAN